MQEIQSVGPRRRFWKRTMIVGVFVLGLCVIGGFVADSIVLASESIADDSGEMVSHSESLLDCFVRHVHDHLREIHRHFHGE